MLSSEQVDLSMLFPEASVVEGSLTTSMPVFLSGEKRQAVYTSTFIPPEEKVEKLTGEVTRVLLNNHLYVISQLCSTTKLTLLRSKSFIDLSTDLDDAAVSLLIDNGLKSRFPTVCSAWKVHNSEIKDATQKSIHQKKKDVDEELRNGKPLLDDALAKEILRRILDAYPYVTPIEFYQ